MEDPGWKIPNGKTQVGNPRWEAPHRTGKGTASGVLAILNGIPSTLAITDPIRQEKVASN